MGSEKHLSLIHILPGDNVMMHVELLTPVAMEEGLRFAIRELSLIHI